MSPSSMKCPHCGLVNWTTAESCKRCRAPINAAAYDAPPAAGWPTDPFAAPAQQNYAPDQHYAPAQPYAAPQQFAPPPPSLQFATAQPAGFAGGFAPQPGFGYQSAPANFPYAYEVPPSKGLAIGALVLGLVSFPLIFVFGLGFLTAITGIVLGFVALSKAKHNPRQYQGRGMAIGGVISSFASMGMFVLIVLAIAVPNILAARNAANEGSAISSLRTIMSAEMTYQATTGRGRYGTLTELAQAGLIDAELASGRKNGYRFSVVLSESDFGVHANPQSYGSGGRRSFFTNSTGVIRAADKRGIDASNLDPPVGESSSRSGNTPSTEYPAPTERGYSPASEASAQSGLKMLLGAESTYQATAGAGKYGTLRQLYDDGLIDSELGNGSKDGYVFKIRADGDRFEATATPKAEYIMVGDSPRSFYMAHDGVIHGATKGGAEATANDPPAEP